jgi:hypothetical protein
MKNRVAVGLEKMLENLDYQMLENGKLREDMAEEDADWVSETFNFMVCRRAVEERLEIMLPWAEKPVKVDVTRASKTVLEQLRANKRRKTSGATA